MFKKMAVVTVQYDSTEEGGEDAQFRSQKRLRARNSPIAAQQFGKSKKILEKMHQVKRGRGPEGPAVQHSVDSASPPQH